MKLGFTLQIKVLELLKYAKRKKRSSQIGKILEKGLGMHF